MRTGEMQLSKQEEPKNQGALSTKQRFVVETYELLRENGLENLRVRDIASRVGCTPAALYKHFESMDHLVMLGSVKFLDGYAKELVPITLYSLDSLTLDLQAWRVFIRHAFENPPIFIHLFWGNASEITFGDIMAEYTAMFGSLHGDDKSQDALYGYYYSAMFEDTLQKRDYVWLRKAAGEGLMKIEDALFVSKTNDCIVHASLIDHMRDYMDPRVREQAIAECIALIEKNIEDHRIRE